MPTNLKQDSGSYSTRKTGANRPVVAIILLGIATAIVGLLLTLNANDLVQSSADLSWHFPIGFAP